MTTLRDSLQSLCGLMDAIYQQQGTNFFSDGPLGTVELLKPPASVLGGPLVSSTYHKCLVTLTGQVWSGERTALLGSVMDACHMMVMQMEYEICSSRVVGMLVDGGEMI